MPDNLSLNDYVEAYAGLEGRALLSTVTKDFKGRAALLSSFGAESVVLLHMVSEVCPELPVVFLDTEKLFPETIAYRNQLVRELGLTGVRTIKPATEDLLKFDPAGMLHKVDTDMCCYLRKTQTVSRRFTCIARLCVDPGQSPENRTIGGFHWA
jgi:phosphoadenosine phosphosulfate reductase